MRVHQGARLSLSNLYVSLDKNDSYLTTCQWILVAKAQDAFIAKRAAGAAPPEFLVRLLQCSGLPKASFLSMMSRLSQLGNESGDAARIFRQLLSPSRLSKWDIARKKGSKSLTQILIGRISAYRRLHHISPSEEASYAAFQIWLEQENATQNVNKMANSQHTLAAGKKFEHFLQNFSESIDNSAVHSRIKTEVKGATESKNRLIDQVPFQSPTISPPSDDTGEEPSVVLRASLFSGEIERIERLLRVSFNWQQSGDRTSLKHAILSIIEDYANVSAQNRKRLSRSIVRWFPVLTLPDGGDDRLFNIIFRTDEGKKGSSTFALQLLHECLFRWNKRQLRKCIKWIVDSGSQNQCSYDRMARFIAFGQSQPSSSFSFFDDDIDQTLLSREQEMFSTSVAVAVKGLNEEKLVRPPRRLMVSASSTLLLLLATTGRNQFRLCCGALLPESPAVHIPESRQIEVFLRLYLRNPTWIDLASGQSRAKLLNASQSFSGRWEDWWSSQDDRIDDLLQSMEHGDAKPVKELLEIARKQPLLILRKLPSIQRMLSRDAALWPPKDRQDKGVIAGRHLDGERDVVISGKITKFSCKHWGYEFFGPMWIAWLDILSHVPKTVLFSCGPPAGLQLFLNVYIQLLNIQLQLLSANEVSRLKEKLKSLFQAYRQTNAESWSQWLRSSIGLSEIRHVLLGCDLIDIQEASDHFQPKDQDS